MIGLPILALSTADVLARTAQLSPAEKLTHELGAADARILWAQAGTAIEQDPRGLNYGWSARPDPESQNGNPTQQSKPSEEEFRKALPPGSTIVSRRSMSTGIRTHNGVKSADLIAFDYSAPTVRGLVRQVSGRAPRTTSEVALTRRLADATGLRVGDTMSLTRPQERDYLIVGLAEDPYHLKAETAFTLPDGKPGATEWYVDTPRGLSWPDVMALNTKGYVATSREVVLHPPPRSAVPYFRGQGRSDNGAQGQTIAAVVLAAGMALLEVVLLAGPAFAVGARRRRRELALVAATGGDRRDVRNIVLAGGAVLGFAAAVAGVAAGVGLAAALLPSLERLSGSVAGHFDVRPLEIAGVAFVGIVTGLI
ncbi:MAG: ABC transporter permease, partial [Actinobacteria bacterium]|nr:ABC transporter permease [Actinomycetota bacterium]